MIKESLIALHTRLGNTLDRMKKSKFDFPHIKMLIAHRVVRGISQRGIAVEIGTSQPTISRIMRQSDVLEMIQEEEKILIQQTKDILNEVSNDPRFLQEFQKALEKELLNFKRFL